MTTQTHSNPTLPLSIVAAALSAAFNDPLRATQTPVKRTRNLRDAWNALATQNTLGSTPKLGLGELSPAKVDGDALCRWLNLSYETREDAHLRVFGLLVSRQCPPCETEYCHWKDPTYRAHQLADVAGFYHAFALEPNHEHPERPDHVSLELEFVAFLLMKIDHASKSDPQHETLSRDAMTSFVRDHVVWWMPTFARCVQRQVEFILATDISPALRDAILALNGVTETLRAWIAAVRLFGGIEPCTRIIAPQVDPELVDDTCKRCSTC